MKFRNDFVTNSSSSSFICEVCGYTESGYDMGLSDAGMVECENGHTFCEEHKRTPSLEELYNWVKTKFSDDAIDELSRRTFFDKDMKFYEIDESTFREAVMDVVNKHLDMDYDLPSIFCPICNLNHISAEEALAYLCKKTSISVEDVEKMIRDEFNSLEDLSDFLK